MLRFRIKRKFDNQLSTGYGSQLVWLLVISALCITVAMLVARFYFNDNIVDWKQILVIFLDLGNMSDIDTEQGWFRLLLGLSGVFLFSILMISVLTNIFNNINNAVRNGQRRYHLKGHVLVLGGGRMVENILKALEGDQRTVAVMSPKKEDIAGSFIYYNGCRTSLSDLKSACVDRADTIYVVGREDEPDLDAANPKTLQLRKELCCSATKAIHCYVTLRDRATSQFFMYLKQSEEERHLLVDIINEYEYQAEQLMVETDFLPVLKTGDRRQPHIIILGRGPVAKAVAYTAAHICHYPGFEEAGVRTRITFIAEGMRQWMDEMAAFNQGLFQLSRYSYVDGDGKAEITMPEGEDFLDVEWEFVDTHALSPLARSIMTGSVQSGNATRIVICQPTSTQTIDTSACLPRPLYREGLVALYLRDSAEIVERANQTGMYGTLRVFGPAGRDISDPLFQRRFTRGQRVNFVYDQAYGNPPSPNKETAWYHLSEAHKYSSIYCANAMALRQRCYEKDAERKSIYEAEHRRWMMSILLIGYRSGTNTDREKFVHADIVPFDALSTEEQEKDKLLIDAMPDIMAPL